ncbi:hypothetical protein FRC06_000527, partial [Ceratobasidium sp. 370]
MSTFNPCGLPDKRYVKLGDPYSFTNVEDFFSELDAPVLQPFSDSNSWTRIENVELYPDQSEHQKRLSHHGAAFRDLDKHRIFVIQFIRPTVFRIRFNPEFNSLDQYTDGNTRNMVQDTLSELISTLDKYEGRCWEVTVEEIEEHGVVYTKIESRPTEPGRDNAFPYFMRIYVRMQDLQIMAVRPTTRHIGRDDVDPDILGLKSTHGNIVEQVVWRTKTKGILYRGKVSVVEVHKPGHSRYLGFGEQGGRGLLMSKVVLDYFLYDNWTYSQVYGQGPLDTREPLYHSEPFWMEVSQHPGYLLKVASFVDNYSQVCLDIGSTDNSAVRVVTRLDTMQLCVVVGDKIGEVIQSYTSIVGRPRLKPRYVLGNHQGCYGYETGEQVRDVVNGYRKAGLPLDGMHIDVDIQREYKTFTVDKTKFPDPAGFFADLRRDGVKCSTNITPFINGQPDDDYPTLNEALRYGYFVKDLRHTEDGGPTNAHHDMYMVYSGGQQRIFRADDLSQEPRPQIGDDYELCRTWNTGKPFRGAVYYGGNRGKPGHYPDLNRKEVRRWWGKQYNELLNWGLEFVWQDMTSPCMGISYGDMKSFPFRLLVSSDAIKGLSKNDRPEILAPSMEVWALYAFNLHKATFNGLEHHPTRKGKRNLIIGRGGFIGLHRHAGLWTGDNSSDWDFMKVSVAQIMSLGLSGVTISGGDVGGFAMSREAGPEWQKWAHPELLMRWYCAYSLLPWFRNHYIAKGQKLFQEPFRYVEALEEPSMVPKNERWLYHATLPICRYYVKLRYTFLQLLYDQMFDNLSTGLPIARALIISNEDDSSLVSENTHFLDDEYMIGDHLLVAPVLDPQGELDPNEKDPRKKVTRVVYLPRPDSWWLCNLRSNGPDHAVRLEEGFVGGSLVPRIARLEFSKHDFDKTPEP